MLMNKLGVKKAKCLTSYTPVKMLFSPGFVIRCPYALDNGKFKH